MPMEMTSSNAEISLNGETLQVPSALIQGRTVVAMGRFVKLASVMDEEFYEDEAVPDFVAFIRALRDSRVKADIFHFARPQPDAGLKCPHLMEWDNEAVIPVTSYADWFEKRLSQDGRRNVRKAAKLGVEVRLAPFDDDLVRGISSIYNETPVRQGRHFWHYGKDLESVKRENATYLERSCFIGAYVGQELIGFIKMVLVGQTASIMQILSKEGHASRRPTNALIAKAVEICAEKGLSRLTYCKYVYGKNDESQLTEFKRRNGFEKHLYPRYYVPLTWKGRLILRLRFHHGVSGAVPKPVWQFLVRQRARVYNLTKRRKTSDAASSVPNKGEF